MDTGIMTDKQCLEMIKKYLPEAKEQLTNIYNEMRTRDVYLGAMKTINCALHRWLPWAIERIEKLEEEQK